MTRKNSKCKIKYCQICGENLQQGNCREEDAYVVRTRKCKKCMTSIHTVELEKEVYNSIVLKYNQISEIVENKVD